MNSENKTCQNCKRDFVIDPEDFGFYEKMQVPPPTWCPECRLQRRLMFRNENFLYKCKSAFSGKEIFSMHPEEGNTKVYENEAWFSDQWSPLSYGKEYDFSRPFFEQLKELFQEVPIFALSVIRGVDSPYSNNFDGYKNCYLVFNGNFCEDCMYSVTLSHSKNSIDLTASSKCENCYEGFWLDSCNNTFLSIQCSDSFNMWFSKSCVGCSDCFGCVNLRNKRYHIFNKPYTKEEYVAKLREFNLGSYLSMVKLQQKAEEFWLQYPVKYMQGLKNTNTTGEYIYNSKNTRNSYLVREAENVRYCQYMEIGPLKDCYDYTVWGSGAELLYEALNTGLGAYGVKFGDECWPEVRDTEYSLYCQSSSNLFGCVGVRKKEFCILNKQYSKEEYKKLRAKIVEHMNAMPYVDGKGRIYKYGEFFPPMLSPFPYNHTPAHEHFPLTKEEALQENCFWKESEDKGYTVSMKASELPDAINEVPDSIANEIILCEDWEENEAAARAHNCTKAFKILPQELLFYRRFNLPLPRKCYRSRHNDRLAHRHSVRLYERQCDCKGGGAKSYKNVSRHAHRDLPCPQTFQTAVSLEKPDIVYCENCYQAEVA